VSARKGKRAWGVVRTCAPPFLYLLEMGTDARAYAMANTDVKRAACVGCGMCAHVCPRGVLKLENKPVRFRAGEPIRVYSVDL